RRRGRAARRARTGRASVDQLIGRQGEEVDELVGERNLRKEPAGVLGVWPVELLSCDEFADELGGHRLAGIDRDAAVYPLPDLRTRDLGRGRVLHEVVDRRGAVAVEPGREVAQSDADV